MQDGFTQLAVRCCPLQKHVDGCQNHGPFLDPYYSTAPNIQGTQKGITSLTSTHVPP